MAAACDRAIRARDANERARRKPLRGAIREMRDERADERHVRDEEHVPFIDVASGKGGEHLRRRDLRPELFQSFNVQWEVCRVE